MSQYRGSKQEQIDKEVEAALGDRVICKQCGATYATFGQKCNVALATLCEGFEAIDEARRPIAARVYGFERKAGKGKKP